jgi:RNA polymerase sigma factor (TIGR02999 family)
MNQVTCILSAIEQGDPAAAEQLLPLVYDELRKLAARKLDHEQPGQTLQATALVHEAYLRLVGVQHFTGRRHFFAAAAEAMRRILVDRARRRKRSKHGGDRQRVDLDSCVALSEDSEDDLVALDEALSRLATHDAPAAELIKLHFFAGIPIEQAGESLGLSRASAYRLWAYARAWLRAEVEGADPGR